MMEFLQGFIAVPLAIITYFMKRMMNDIRKIRVEMETLKPAIAELQQKFGE
jgi:hypothetical protein